MKPFTKLVFNECTNLFDYDFNSSYKELIMALFMQILSYKYDDKINNEIRFNNIEEINQTVYQPINPKTNDLVGRPLFFDDEELNKFNSLDLNNKTMYILNEIRGSIVHGSFRINDDGTITITDNFFQMTFELDCIIDICFIIANNLRIYDETIKELYEFIEYVKNLNNNTYETNVEKIKNKFIRLKYPIILFNLLPMNEDDFHNDPEYSDFIVQLFLKKEHYKNGNFKSNADLEVRELYKLRNCIAHGQYYNTDTDLILFDNKDSYVYSLLELEELFSQNKNIQR